MEIEQTKIPNSILSGSYQAIFNIYKFPIPPSKIKPLAPCSLCDETERRSTTERPLPPPHHPPVLENIDLDFGALFTACAKEIDVSYIVFRIVYWNGDKYIWESKYK